MSKVNSQTEYLLNLDESSKSPETIIAKVTDCLSPHEKCTGRYTDFSFKYVIVCHCECHTKKQALEKSIEGSLSNARGNNLPVQERTQNDQV